jgi:hypothetical protein
MNLSFEFPTAVSHTCCKLPSVETQPGHRRKRIAIAPAFVTG